METTIMIKPFQDPEQQTDQNNQKRRKAIERKGENI